VIRKMALNKIALLKKIAEDVVSVADEFESMGKFAEASVMDKILKEIVAQPVDPMNPMNQPNVASFIPQMAIPNFNDSISNKAQQKIQPPVDLNTVAVGDNVPGGDISPSLKKVEDMVFQIRSVVLDGIKLTNDPDVMRDPKGSKYADAISKIGDIATKAIKEITQPEEMQMSGTDESGKEKKEGSGTAKSFI
jgi:hypothetical protein